MNIAVATSVLLAAALAGCSAPEQPGSGDPDPMLGTPAADGETGEGSAEEAAVSDSANGTERVDLPSEFSRTAWRAIAADGARFTTFLDDDGRYRDLRNGDPWQEGTWSIDQQDRLCFLPDAAGGVLRCWHPDRMQGSDRLIVSGDNGLRIRLDRADYAPPPDDADD